MYADIPHVAPKGVNSGMIVMNLTKMREYNWQTRIVRLYDDYTKITDYMEDQRLLNIILYYDPGKQNCKLNWLSVCLDSNVTANYMLM